MKVARSWLVLCVGVVLLGASMASFGWASRKAYHRMTFTQKIKTPQRDVRRFSGRYRAFSYRLKKSSSYSERKDYYRSRSIARTKNTRRVSRASEPRPSVFSTITHYDQPSFQKEGAYVPLKYNEFTADIPEGFFLYKDGIFRHKSESLTFRVIRTASDYSCVSESFSLCARSLGETFKSTQGITSANSYQGVARMGQSQAHTFERFPTFIERFSAHSFGADNVYFVLSALDPDDGSVVRVEGVADRRSEKKSAVLFHQVARSFRF